MGWYLSPVDSGRDALDIPLGKESQAAGVIVDSHKFILNAQNHTDTPSPTDTPKSVEMQLIAGNGSPGGEESLDFTFSGGGKVSFIPASRISIQNDSPGALGGSLLLGPTTGNINRISYTASYDGTVPALIAIADNAAVGIGMAKGLLAISDSTNDGGDLTVGSTLATEKHFPWSGTFVTIGGMSAIGDTVRIRPYPGTVKTGGTLLAIGNDNGAGTFSERASFDFNGNLSILGPSASAGTSIKLRRTDGTIVTLTVDNTNSWVIT